MELSEMVRHAVISVARNRKSSFISVIGVAFALAFVFGTLMAVETVYDSLDQIGGYASVDGHDGAALVSSWNNAEKSEETIIVLAMSSPSIAVGLIVAVAGVNLGFSLRAEEAKHLRSKGVSSGQVFTVLMMEAFVLGMLAVIVCLVISVMVGQAVLDPIAIFITEEQPDPEIGDAGLTITGPLLRNLIESGLGLMFLVSIVPSWRLSKVVEAEKPSLPRKNKEAGLGTLLDVVLIALALASIIDILSGWTWEGSHGFDWYTGSVDAFIGAFGLVLFPAMPFLLSVGLARLLTRPPIMLHKRFGRSNAVPEVGLKPRAVEEDPVDRKRATRACVLIALVLTFGMFTSVTIQSMIEHDRAAARYDVGADIAISASYQGNFDGTDWIPEFQFSELSKLKSIPGVENASITGIFYQTFYGVVAAAMVLDPEDFLAVRGTNEDYFRQLEMDNISELDEIGSAVVSERFANNNAVLVGSQLMIDVVGHGDPTLDREHWYVNVTVKGTIGGPEESVPADLFVSYETMSVVPLFNLSMIFNGIGARIDVGEGFNHSEVVAAADAVFNDAGLPAHYTSSLEEEYAQIDNNMFYNGLGDLLVGEYIYLLLVVLIAVGLIVYVAVYQARKKDAGRNPPEISSPRQERMAVSESFATVTLGIAIGTFVGLVTIYLFNMMWVPVEWEPVARMVVFTDTAVFMIVTSMACLIITPFVGVLLARLPKVKALEQSRGRP